MLSTINKLKPALRIGLIGMAAVSLSACVALYRNHGYVPNDEDLAEIQVGVDTRDSVTEAVGTPGSAGVLRDSGFYYVSTRMRHYGATAPKVVSRELVAISFNQSGVVQNIERFGLEDGRVVPLSRRVTSSSVESNTFLRQLMGNLGNFNPGDALGE
ncbi:outer membrane protein assembly factor BamE [Phaeobacter marinintestinus]|uniref:outer membrane protein assembly factor BamE n=1 Tax=Falsiphaeobacter marinintestinus TaxID=1492905 RepID=UPI0011B7ACA7|nr:outer membrane protein assembly factor BamE [Phaeobacter marinintestinus]